MMMNDKVVRADYNEKTITVYQAYPYNIAASAVEARTFISPSFKIDRMTWVKPSFLWMMYRSGWASKRNQELILQIKIKRTGFEWALDNACLSHYEKSLYNSQDDWSALLKESPVTIQWDPEKNIFLQSLNYRTIQIGLKGIAVEKYVSEWILEIQDITDLCRYINSLVSEGKINQAKESLPHERIYPLPDDISTKIGQL